MFLNCYFVFAKITPKITANKASAAPANSAKIFWLNPPIQHKTPPITAKQIIKTVFHVFTFLVSSCSYSHFFDCFVSVTLQFFAPLVCWRCSQRPFPNTSTELLPRRALRRIPIPARPFRRTGRAGNISGLCYFPAFAYSCNLSAIVCKS